MSTQRVWKLHPQHGSQISHKGIYHTFNKGTDISSYSLEKSRKENQCNYSEENDFCYKCRCSRVPSLNCMGKDSLYTGISVIVMSANSFGQEEECGQVSILSLTHLALWVCCRVESSSLCPVGSVALHPRPLAPLWRLIQNPEWQERISETDPPHQDHYRALWITEYIIITYSFKCWLKKNSNQKLIKFIF